MMPLLTAARFRSRPPQAFSLVVTLIIIAMLAVIVVGFLASMSTERTTASAFANKARADQAAQAGVDSAMAILRQAFRDFPDSATVWEVQSQTVPASGSTGAPTAGGSPTPSPNEGTSLYVHAVPNPDPSKSNQPDPTANGSGTTALNLNSPSNVLPNTDARPGADARSTFVLPLVSGASWELLADRAKAINSGADLQADDKLFPNLNSRRSATDSQGWIGTAPPLPGVTTPTTPKPVRVPWVEISQPDGYNAPSKGPVIARYAFWVEDESFRTNVNYAGLGDASSGTPTHLRRDNPLNYPLNSTDLDLLSPLLALTDDNAAKIAAKSISETRNLYPGLLFPEEGAYTHAPALSGATALTDQLRFLTTTQSGGLNLSRHGTQRLNLNELMYPRTTNTYTPQEQIDDLVGTIKYHASNFGQRFYRLDTSTSPSSLNALSVTANDDSTNQDERHSLIYLYKIATNIVDYMDSDPYSGVAPTFVDNTGKVVTGNFTDLLAFDNGDNPIWAQGKDSAPFLEEGAVRFRGGPVANGSEYRLAIDYYLEFWNMTGRDVKASDLGPNPRIRVANPPVWVGDLTATPANTHPTYLPCKDPSPIDASPSATRGYPMSDSKVKPKPMRDYDIDLSTVTFRAGAATVITTDPDFKGNNPDTLGNSDPKGIIQDAASQSNVFVCGFYPPPPRPPGPGKRLYAGAMPIADGSSARCDRLRVILGGGYSSTGGSDYQTSVVLYTDNGYIESLEGALPMSGSFLLQSPALKTSPILFGGSLRGNSGTTNPAAPYPSITGDARTNNEQLAIETYNTNAQVDQTRYFNFTYSSNSGAGSDASLGKPNTNFVIPDNTASPYTPWADYYHFTGPYGVADPTARATTLAAIASTAPAVIANSPLTSIGQLGDIFDPARYTAGKVKGARGGGRTLKIGQHDDRWDGDETSASHTWASWRLADFFCAPAGATTGTGSAPTSPFPDVMFQPGLININGVARDNGVALRAALTGYKYQISPLPLNQSQPLYPLGDPKLSGTAVDAAISASSDPTVLTGVGAMIAEIKARLITVPTPGNLGPDKYGPRNTGTGPFFERGEISELTQFGRNVVPTFPPSSFTANKLTGTDMGFVLDRGREELFRRLVETTTTRGNVFTVYAMGQAIKQVGTVKNVASTQMLKVTFRLMPKTSNGDDFHPATDKSGLPIKYDLSRKSTQLAVRFAKPDHYDIQILSSSKGGG